MAPAEPCWEKQNCSEGKMAQCAAHQHPEQPCWQARFQAEGHIPVRCVECELFDQYPTPSRAKEASNNATKMA